MRIFLKAENSELPQWIIVELNGKLQSPISTTLRGMTLGDVTFIPKKNAKDEQKIQMLIGNSKLKGRVVNLKKPLIITDKKARINPQSGKRELKVVGIARQKYEFLARPSFVLMHQCCICHN